MAFHLPATRGVELQPVSNAERTTTLHPGAPRRVGLHRSLPAGALDQGAWITLPNGKQIWQVSIHSPGAVQLRVQIGEFAAGAGRVWVHNGVEADGPYTGAGIYGNGEFWSG